ncbi:MAG: bifunctional 3-deoxy-7-phosphoheptulonate synthase/chorismate mutase type II [Bacteroidetes bacterium]|nr:bifunctional 3-deoxy-7-phosphoheptulonate synthase/chorismate mutase type II [Bacteroidota bacterium]MBS1629694.1 bifunctional 3-deoxy-7-phosphoheptulonate synthase/chorismate mutase type II [Bacteroidota bacterium]
MLEADFQVPALDHLWQQRPLIIAGPCSAETEEQVLTTATALAASGQVHLFRAGLWKPRTRPGSFEGVGSLGLGWMQQVRQLTGLPTATEVASASQVEQALKAGIDVLWIGARTTVNPFSVQEIADALRGLNQPVFVKNPLNADVDLWTGAVERVAKAGIQHIGLIHRGFASYANTEFRHAPMWHLAIEMKRRHPDLLFINDPSHICGRRDKLQGVAQRAADLGCDGLMIECHPRPDEAWSDAAQQLSPEGLRHLLDGITWRRQDAAQAACHAALEQLRQRIDGLDDEIVQLLSQRMKLAEQIGAYKKTHDIAILQTARWNQILDRILDSSERLGLSEEFIHRFLEAVHLESIAHQTAVFGKEK